MVELYKPANATEGFQFESVFCNQCTHENNDGSSNNNMHCDIHMYAIIFDIDDPSYPCEWAYDSHGKPVCTSFTQDPKLYRCDKTIDMFSEHSSPAKDYVHSQFSGPITKVPFTKPDEGYLKCCSCGSVAEFKANMTYEEQCCCKHEECDGQMFCNKWRNWQVSSFK